MEGYEQQAAIATSTHTTSRSEEKDPPRFNYGEWEWELLRPSDLFGPSSELSVLEQRVAMILHATANTRTGFTFVTSARIAGYLSRHDPGRGTSRGPSRSKVDAARAVLARRGFIERAYESDQRGWTRKGWRLLHCSNWRTKSTEGHHREAGPSPKTPPAGVFNSPAGTEKLPQGEFRQGSDSIEGTSQTTLPFNNSQPLLLPERAAPGQEDKPRQQMIARLVAVGIQAATGQRLIADFDGPQLQISLANLEQKRKRKNATPISDPAAWLAASVRRKDAPLQMPSPSQDRQPEHVQEERSALAERKSSQLARGRKILDALGSLGVERLEQLRSAAAAYNLSVGLYPIATVLQSADLAKLSELPLTSDELFKQLEREAQNDE